MGRFADPQAMSPARPGRTRTAPPVMPAEFPTRGNYRTYMLFGACCVFFLLSSLLFLRVVDALAAGPDAWDELLREFRHPLYLAYNVAALAGFLFTARRFLFQLFAKSQPPRIGPLPRPPLALFPPLLGAAWLAATALVFCILWGAFP
ncbi:MAG TPA: hypothetical protein VKE73_12595 [Myxococcota bacterium]|nr:hypothetical protein [Myxococcota bacterium]